MGSHVPTPRTPALLVGDGGGCVAGPKPQQRETFWEAPLTWVSSLYHRTMEGLVVSLGAGDRDGDRDEVSMGGDSFVFGSCGAGVVCGKGHICQTSCSQLQQAPACPLPGAWIQPYFQPL